jgi:hypothetical protein
MPQSESQDPSDRAAIGFCAVLMRVHEPLLESIFWLALGCVLGWQDEECVVRINKKDDQCYGAGMEKKLSQEKLHTLKEGAMYRIYVRPSKSDSSTEWYDKEPHG